MYYNIQQGEYFLEADPHLKNRLLEIDPREDYRRTLVHVLPIFLVLYMV